MTKTKKTTIMSILIFAATTIAGLIETNGIPSTVLAWETLGLTALGTIAVWAAQSFFIPSTSELGQFNWRDFWKGAIIAVGNVLSSTIVASLTGTIADVKAIAASTITILIGYAIKQFRTIPTGIPPTK